MSKQKREEESYVTVNEAFKWNPKNSRLNAPIYSETIGDVNNKNTENNFYKDNESNKDASATLLNSNSFKNHSYQAILKRKSD